MSNVPYDEEWLPKNLYEDYNYHDIHDSIVKLPGRHYPKLPYSAPSKSANFNSHGASHFNSQELPNDWWQSSETFSSEPKVSPLLTNRHHNFEKIDKYLTNQNDEEHRNDLVTESIVGVKDPSLGVRSPMFDRGIPRDVTVQTGRTAELVCGVIGTHDESVSNSCFYYTDYLLIRR